MIIGKPDFRDLTFTINDAVFHYGAFITDVIQFVAVAAAVFFFVVKPMARCSHGWAAPPKRACPTRNGAIRSSCGRSGRSPRASLVLDPLQVETGAGPSFLLPLAPPLRVVGPDQRAIARASSDECAHHVAQEAVRRDLELERVASLEPSGCANLPREARVPGDGLRERAEVVLSDQGVGGRGQRVVVERARVPVAPVDLEGRRRLPAPDAVPITPRAGGVPRMEIRSRLLGRDTETSAGSADSAPSPRSRPEARLRRRARTLAERMHACVRSPGSCELSYEEKTE